MSEKTISEATPVRVGLVILLLGAFGSGVWWAASINSKLDSILTNQSVTGNAIAEIKGTEAAIQNKLGDLTLRVAILESKTPEPPRK